MIKQIKRHLNKKRQKKIATELLKQANLKIQTALLTAQFKETTLDREKTLKILHDLYLATKALEIYS